MDVFTTFFCYAKRQKKGPVQPDKLIPATVEKPGNDASLFEHDEVVEDDDILPITNIGFRY
ncbi:hypothetical protein [Methanooceanicella nereidis]|nr:hypothetical protein [Methanocella sp. CWC-04]